MENIYTTVVGTNAVLMANIAKLYFKSNWKIADVTYGKGVFWKNIDIDLYNLYCSDIITCKETPYDFRCLPYNNDTFDCVVFDPPYMHTVGTPTVDNNYKNSKTTKGMYHKDIMLLYKDGIKEAVRILKQDGFLLIKCQDEIESGFQRWSHIEIYNIAVSMGLYAKDLFILIRHGNPNIQYRQQHARKKHSYMWVFQKISSNDYKRFIEKGIL